MTPLSGLLPLRTTAVWAAYREAAVIPHRYGVSRGALLQYAADRRVFVWADHPVVSVDEVLIDAQPVSNWQWYNAPDSTGQAVCFVEFDAAVDEGTTPMASGRGKRDPNSGEMIANPADVLRDLLLIAGRVVLPGQLEPFGRACKAEGLTVGGSLTRSDVAVQAAARELCESVGAVFAPDASDIAFLHPGGAAVAPRARIERAIAIIPVSTLDNVVTDLTLRFDFEGDTPRQTVRLDAPGAVSQYGRRIQVRDARWITSARVAVSVGTRLLQHAARFVWRVQTGPLPRLLALGEGVALDHPRLPLTGTYPILARTADIEEGTCSVEFEVGPATLPAVRLVSQSSRISPEQYTGVDVRTEGGLRVITLNEEDGSPIVQAEVTLNGQTKRTTDGAGRVSFPTSLMPSGEHVLTIVTSDGRTLTTTVLVP